MTFTEAQIGALKGCVVNSLESDLRAGPRHWAWVIAAQWEPEAMVDYLDLDNRGPDEVEEIVEYLGFDPRGEDAPTVEDGWPAEDPDWPLADWRYEITNGDTRLGYTEWVAHNKENAKDDRE